MAITVSRHYLFHLYKPGQQQHQPFQFQNIKPTDIFSFDINLTLQICYTDSNSRVHRVNNTSLASSSLYIHCKNFFQEGQDVLRRHLCHPCFASDSLDLIRQCVISKVRQLYDQSLPSSSSSSDPDSGFAKPNSGLESSVFPLALEVIMVVIVVEEVPDDEYEGAVMEESMLDFRMIPATKEAIDSLKKTKIKEQTEQCNICMEEFDVGGDDVSAMPCNHVFHQQCIVRWLQTSHTCPLCRYPMPTASGCSD